MSKVIGCMLFALGLLVPISARANLVPSVPCGIILNSAGLGQPADITVAPTTIGATPAGAVFVATTGGKVMVFPGGLPLPFGCSAAAIQLTFSPVPPMPPTAFWGIDFDPTGGLNGTLYLSGTTTAGGTPINQIFKIVLTTPTAGAISLVATIPGTLVHQLRSVSLDGGPNLYAADFCQGQVHVINKASGLVTPNVITYKGVFGVNVIKELNPTWVVLTSNEGTAPPPCPNLNPPSQQSVSWANNFPLATAAAACTATGAGDVNCLLLGNSTSADLFPVKPFPQGITHKGECAYYADSLNVQELAWPPTVSPSRNATMFHTTLMFPGTGQGASQGVTKNNTGRLLTTDSILRFGVFFYIWQTIGTPPDPDIAPC